MAGFRAIPAMATKVGLLFTLTFLHALKSVRATDLDCLMSFKQSISDPANYLQGWTSTITNQNEICTWLGVGCYGNNYTLPLSKIQLPSAGLSGSFPNMSLCANYIQFLDLSNNIFTGPIPDSLCTYLPNLVSLDLSHNALAGNIPRNMSRCMFLNDLFLENNQLTGSIPGELGQLTRLTQFNVANNQLSGELPPFVNRTKGGFNASDFTGNPGLCGALLGSTCGTSSGNKTSIGAIIGGVVGGLFVLVALSALLLWYFVTQSRTGLSGKTRDDSKWAKRIRQPKAINVSMFEKPIVKIKLAHLMLATNDFSPENIIGSGRTGTVYKAAFPDGSVMAIKRLQMTAHSDRQFRAEMETLGHHRHRNLVPLLGFCIAGTERLLVYKHMPNGTVRQRLHQVPEKDSPLDWPTRVKVATGGARGLAWLHHSCNPRVIHRNISASCILLDDDNEARITDFGLARLMNPVETHISTFVNGDFGDVGYVAPEYIRTLVATTKGDVYSFGVVLLELITGQKPVDVVAGEGFKGNLVDWVMVLSNTSRLSEGVDPFLKNNGVDDEIMQIFKVACSCVLVGAKERPTMFEVFQLLRAIGEKYNFTDPFDDLPSLSTSADLSMSHEVIVSVKQ